jgi:excisionase family DNA binding protein
MAKLTISDAARVTGVSRMLLYRYIKAGKLSRTPDGGSRSNHRILYG